MRSAGFCKPASATASPSHPFRASAPAGQAKKLSSLDDEQLELTERDLWEDEAGMVPVCWWTTLLGNSMMSYETCCPVPAWKPSLATVLCMIPVLMLHLCNSTVSSLPVTLSQSCFGQEMHACIDRQLGSVPCLEDSSKLVASCANHTFLHLTHARRILHHCHTEPTAIQSCRPIRRRRSCVDLHLGSKSWTRPQQ